MHSEMHQSSNGYNLFGLVIEMFFFLICPLIFLKVRIICVTFISRKKLKRRVKTVKMKDNPTMIKEHTELDLALEKGP